MLENIREQPEGVLYLQRVIEADFRVPLLLIGDQGTGRRYSVLEAVKCVLVEEAQVYQLNHGVHPDFRVAQVEDEKDIKVEVIRDLLEEVHVHPSRARWKMFLIDGADHMTVAAANALLKVLEEPPEKTRFFLLAEQCEGVLPTIRSRCAMVRYRRLSEAFIMSRVIHHVNDEVKALTYTRMAEGSLGRALRYASTGRLVLRDVMISMLESASRKDLSTLFRAVDDLANDIALGLRFLDQIVRDLIVVRRTRQCLINCDVAERLAGLLGQMRGQQVEEIQAGLRVLRANAQGSINVPFHLKSVLASSGT